MFLYNGGIYISLQLWQYTFLIRIAFSGSKFEFMTYFDDVIHKFPFSFYCCISWVA